MVKFLFFFDKNHLGVPLQIGQGMTPAPSLPFMKMYKIITLINA